MWVFDGEEWTQDDGGVEPKVTPAASHPREEEEWMTQLQVVEITELPKRKGIPPFPLT